MTIGPAFASVAPVENTANVVRTGQFVIFIETVDEKNKPVTKFLQNDGYSTFFNNPKDAEKFKSFEDAVSCLTTNPIFTKNSVMSDGTVYPPRAIHNALGLNDALTENHGVFSIAEICYDVRQQNPVSSKLFVEPNTKEEKRAAALAKLTPQDREALGL